jgi:hypothetical protein
MNTLHTLLYTIIIPSSSSLISFSAVGVHSTQMTTIMIVKEKIIRKQIIMAQGDILVIGFNL